MVVGQPAADELLKGALVSVIIKAIKQTGFGPNLGLGLYVNTTFPLPTASDAFGRVSPPMLPALPAGTAVPAVAAAKLGAYSRFRQRYGGRF
jgi:hypothetical protein